MKTFGLTVSLKTWRREQHRNRRERRETMVFLKSGETKICVTKTWKVTLRVVFRKSLPALLHTVLVVYSTLYLQWDQQGALWAFFASGRGGDQTRDKSLFICWHVDWCLEIKCVSSLHVSSRAPCVELGVFVLLCNSESECVRLTELVNWLCGWRSEQISASLPSTPRGTGAAEKS